MAHVEEKKCKKCGFRWKSKIKRGVLTRPECPNCVTESVDKPVEQAL